MGGRRVMPTTLEPALDGPTSAGNGPMGSSVPAYPPGSGLLYGSIRSRADPMNEVDRPGQPREGRLDSWKEIAGYLKRGVTTVQRWEKEEGLPVHRLAHARAGSVHAWTSEIEEWWRERSQVPSPVSGRGRGSARLLVLPFHNPSGDPAQERLADDLTEELIARLAERCSPDLAVIARMSAMAYKGTRKRVREIADEFGLRYLIESSVRRSGEHVRIVTQLIDAHDETYRWSGVYQQPLKNLLELQAEVTEAVAREVIPRAVCRRPRPGCIRHHPSSKGTLRR
jgi:TolB-like protein